MYEAIFGFICIIALGITYKIVVGRYLNGPGSGNNTDGNPGVETRVREIDDRLNDDQGAVERSKEHLGNAEEILTKAINRSRKKRETVESGGSDN